MKITLSKKQWMDIGNKTGWANQTKKRAIAQETTKENQYYIETHVDDQKLHGSEGTTILESLGNFRKDLRGAIQRLQQLVNSNPKIKRAKNIILKLVDWKGNIMQTFDVTDHVHNVAYAKSKNKLKA